MPESNVRRLAVLALAALLAALPIGLLAQAGQRGAPAGAPAAATGRSAAPVDLTGYWVSIVTEDWIERMSPDSPPSGTGGARGLAALRGQAANPPPANEQCRVYGAAGSMRVPGRLRISWQDDNTLKIDMDAGTQTRLLHFNQTTAPPGEKTLQGYSIASWDLGPPARGGGGGRGGGAAPAAPRWGKLNVVTSNMKGGYLLSSRSFYSDNATLTEYFSKHSAFGAEYFTVTAVVQDPGSNTRITSSTFKKEPDGSKFKPRGCEVVR
jgi:hypothetical protein